MIIKVIMAQRKQDYPGQYAPNALECVTEDEYASNPHWLDAKLLEYTQDFGFASIKVVDIMVSDQAINDILNPVYKPIDGTVKS